MSISCSVRFSPHFPFSLSPDFFLRVPGSYIRGLISGFLLKLFLPGFPAVRLGITLGNTNGVPLARRTKNEILDRVKVFRVPKAPQVLTFALATPCTRTGLMQRTKRIGNPRPETVSHRYGSHRSVLTGCPVAWLQLSRYLRRTRPSDHRLTSASGTTLQTALRA